MLVPVLSQCWLESVSRFFTHLFTVCVFHFLTHSLTHAQSTPANKQQQEHPLDPIFTVSPSEFESFAARMLPLLAEGGDDDVTTMELQDNPTDSIAIDRLLELNRHLIDREAVLLTMPARKMPTELVARGSFVFLC